MSTSEMSVHFLDTLLMAACGPGCSAAVDTLEPWLGTWPSIFQLLLQLVLQIRGGLGSVHLRT